MTFSASDAEQQIDALAVRLREAEAACAAKDSFIAAISRELNNPLAPVLLAVEHLRAVFPDADAARLETAMQMLERATDGFARRTRLLLDLADMMAGAAPLSVTSVDVSGLVTTAASEMSEMARLARSSVVLEAPPGLVALANAQALHQVVAQVLTNAFRFGAGRPVRLSVHQDPQGGVVITVSDQGPGIDPAKAARLFALFRQTRTPLEPGLGIGLWVSAQLVEAMGGRIGVADVKGEGAHFHVRLPAASGAPVAPVAQNLQTRHETGASDAGAS